MVAAVPHSKMSDINLEKFSGSSYKEWENWFDDYKLFAELKKWSADKKVSFLRFFVSGNVKEALRQESCDSLEQADEAIKRVLGGPPDQLSAARCLDSEQYRGDIQDYLIRVQSGARLAYPHLNDSARNDVVLLHLQRALPVEYGREITRLECKTLEAAVKVISANERADSLYGSKSGHLCRVSQAPDNTQESQTPRKTQENSVQPDRRTCFVCGLVGHFRRSCPFRNDVCGACGRRGHLSQVCRSLSGNDSRFLGARGAQGPATGFQPQTQ